MILNITGSNTGSLAFIDGFNVSFKVFAILALFGIAASLARGKKDKLEIRA